MKTTIRLLAVLCLSAAFGNGQTGSQAKDTDLQLNAQTIDSRGPVILCRGDVKITVGAIAIQADEADYDTNTGELTLRGNVRAKPLASVKTICEGDGCVSADSPQALAMRKIADAMKTVMDSHGQTPK
jgi:lipopolysaccharide assembly outer membrane protein LptD (OstA)